MENGEAANLNNDGKGNGAAGEGNQPAWIAQLPEDMRGDESFQQFATIGDLAKAHGSLTSERDGLIKVPGEDASDEEKTAFAQKMGRPETVDGYELGKPEDWPEGIEYHSDLENAYKGMAFEAGISNDTAQKVLNWYNKVALDEHKAIEAAVNQSVDELKDKWKGDDFKVNSEIASRAMLSYAEQTIGKEEATKFFDTAMINGVPIGSHPLMLQIFKEIGVTISDDNSNGGRGGAGGELSEEQKAEKRFPNTNFNK